MLGVPPPKMSKASLIVSTDQPEKNGTLPGRGEGGGLVPRKAEVDKPLLEQPPRHLLQERDPASVHLDQVVIGPEDGCNAALGLEGRQVQLEG